MRREEIIQRAALAALMHVKPDYRSPKRLDAAAGVIALFVEGALADEERRRDKILAVAFGETLESDSE